MAVMERGDDKRQTPYFNFALRYRPQVEAILREGKTIMSLRNGEEFRTVPFHSIKVATICDTLGGYLGLDSVTQENLNVTAILHDADKRLEYKPEEFNSLEKQALKKALTKMHVDQNLLSATKEKFVEENKDNVDTIPISQVLLYYADMIVSWDKIVSFENRITESASRRPELTKSFFAMELKFGKAIEARIFNSLPKEIENKIKIPEQIPDFLRASLEGK